MVFPFRPLQQRANVSDGIDNCDLVERNGSQWDTLAAQFAFGQRPPSCARFLRAAGLQCDFLQNLAEVADCRPPARPLARLSLRSSISWAFSSTQVFARPSFALA